MALVRRLPRRPLRDARRPARPRGRRSGHGPAADRAHRPHLRPDADVPLRRPGRGRRERDAERRRRARGPRGALPADRLRPARDRTLRAAALPAPGARPAPARHRRRRGLREPARRRPPPLHDAGLGRRHGGDPGRARRREADAVRDLLRHRARDRVRARLSGPRRAADPRLGRRRRRPRSVLHRRVPRDGADPALAVPGPLPRHLRRPGGRPRRSSSRSSASTPLRAFAYDSLGRSHRVTIGPTRAARPDVPDATTCRRCARRCRPRSRAGLERRRRAARPARSASRGRSRSSARRATSRSPATRPSARRRRCRGIRARRSTSGRRSSSSGSRPRPPARSRRSTPPSSSRTRSTCACAGRTCRASPAAAPAAPYPTVPTLILQGGEDLRTPPEWSARVAARIPGAKRLVVPGVGHSTVSDPRGCAADAILRFVRGALGADALLARPHRRARRGRRRRRTSTRCPATPASRARSGARCARSRRRSTTSGSCCRRPCSPPPAAACAAARGRCSGGRLVLRDYQAVTGVTVNGGGSRVADAARAGRQGGERDGHAAHSRTAHRTARRPHDLRPARHAAGVDRPARRVGALTLDSRSHRGRSHRRFRRAVSEAGCRHAARSRRRV